MHVDRHRKDAKRLVRAYRAGDPEAVARVDRALGARARARFLLSDALHVVAVERGYRTWPDLKRSGESAGPERVDETRQTDLAYGAGDPVCVRVTRRGARFLFTDDAGGVDRSGRPPGWRDAAQRAVDADYLNLSRSGAVFVTANAPGRRRADDLVRRVAALSLAVYEEILDLEG